MERRARFWTGGAMLALGLTAGSAQAAEVYLSAQAGYRVDTLDWQASSASETWKSQWGSMEVYHTRFGADVKIDRIHIRGMVGYGVFGTGLFRDSWSLDEIDRNGTANAIEGQPSGDVIDTDIAIGYSFLLNHVEHRYLYFMPTIGYSYHKQNITNEDGRNRADNSAVAGYARTYDIEWDGLWVGFNLWEVDKSQDFTISAELAYYFPDFYASGDLRGDPNAADFQSPVSFEHGLGSSIEGTRFSLYGNYALSVSLDLVFGFDYQTWTAEDSIQRNRYSDGTTADLTLSSVNWDSTSVSVGLAYFFE